MSRRPTIIDVAREADVSKSTVSLVLQNSALVKAETRAQVEAAIARIGYVYNRAAATLRSSNAGLIGLIINDLRNPYFTEFATSVQMTLAARGYAVVLANTDEDPALQTQVLGAMIEHGVSGVVLSPAYGGEAQVFDMLTRAGIPAMQVLRKVHPRTDLFPFASPDNVAGSRLATAHLLAAGARRIAFMGGVAGQFVTDERRRGYLAALAGAGLAPLMFDGRSTRAFGHELAGRLAADHPQVDGVLCFNDLAALGLLSGCAQIGRRVGDGFRIVGFDDIEDSALAYPSLSSVRGNIASFGRDIAETMVAWLTDGIKPSPETRTRVELVVRESSKRS